ncbi:3-phosphoshikimate 1-carboxyvinyltransferase [Thermosporothrix hazakensis]|jgi:3-phosphoshikimate 1-carboxyvinyltransferase|uniref:3-phosphoshikimate 1-carboxyvinyltransferase n=1 Tax=Thermosporothrix hazakensis TaxID=644383 RepID=A0A326UD89_THEHA|nr:3-phosphoshikimate 1-carboxyvinyltransferase [Thermosporothrix hazakensis]PZW36467.1 3-phosphoshikimate 1-carboxyvinyltransferase [Thermosporothrix hazakensis]GCE47122.1 3-phosphoshikimate 1-carboxyvinyltransferase [Thermosporothrix hazakensis]
MQEPLITSPVPGQTLTVAPVAGSLRISGQPEIPSSKYYTLRYVLAATLADGESVIYYPAQSDDSEALFRGCRALGAQLAWDDAERRVLRIKGIGGRPPVQGPVTIEVGNAGAVLRLLLGLGALLPQVTFETDHPLSLGKRPNRELLEALASLGVAYEATGPEGCVPLTLHGGNLRGGHIRISGARSSQYLSALLFLCPLLTEPVEIEVVDMLKSQPLARATLEVLQEAGIVIEHDAALRHFKIQPNQRYQPREYVIPGDYPSAAALLAAASVATDPASELRLTRLRPGEEIGEALLSAFRAMGADLVRDGEQITLRGGRPLHGIELDGDVVIDCIPVLVAAACFAEGRSVFFNIESLHYKESDRIDDLCAELQRAGCDVEPRQDAIIVNGRPEGIEGGVTVDGHNDHRLLMALAIVGMRSRHGLTITGGEHIVKSYPHFFAVLRALGANLY